jgi:hypothetical protein
MLNFLRYLISDKKSLNVEKTTPHSPLSPLVCLREAASAKAGERDGVRGFH